MQPRAFSFVRRIPYIYSNIYIIYVARATGISYAIEEQMHLQQDKNEMAEVHARLVRVLMMVQLEPEKGEKVPYMYIYIYR